MKSKVKQIMKLIIVLLALTVFILPIYIERYKDRSEYVFEVEDFDFTEEIRNVNFHMTKEDIYVLEGRREDLIDNNTNGEILVFNNAKMNDYTGIIRYFFENEKLTIVQFEFRDSSDYNKYLKEFRNKYSQGREFPSFFWTWDGHIEGYEVTFGAYDLGFIIDKGEYREK